MVLTPPVIPDHKVASFPTERHLGKPTRPTRETRDLPRCFTAAGLPAESGSRLHAVQGGGAASHLMLFPRGKREMRQVVTERERMM